MTTITVITYNGLGNRLLPLISSIRLSRKSNRKTNMLWGYTPVRSCMTYYGDLCKFEELYEKIEDLSIDENINSENVFEFKYWENKDHVVDINVDGNITINYALYTIISEDDNKDSIFNNLKKSISFSREIIFDDIGRELSNVMKSFRPKKEFQDEIDKYGRKFYKNMVGIHIRKSDGGFTEFSWDDIVRTIIFRCREWCNSDMNNGVYLATDDSEVYVQFASCLGSKLVFYNPPRKLGGVSSINKFNNDKFNVFCAVIELALLGKCNKYIVGTCDSTFSMTGMLLSDENTKKYLVKDVAGVPNFHELTIKIPSEIPMKFQRISR